MAIGYTSAPVTVASLSDLYRAANREVRRVLNPDADKPLDTAADSTFEGWLTCGDGRTLWEYANHMRP